MIELDYIDMEKEEQKKKEEQKTKKKTLYQKKTISYYLQNEIEENNINKCICKIIFKKKGIFLAATGFFCHLPQIDIDIFLITNNHVIDEDDLKNGIKINIKINDKIQKVIDLSKNRFKYTNNKLDFTLIEILELDNIHDYLNVDDYMGFKDYKKDEIYCLQYPLGQILQFSEGEVIPITKEKDKILHNIVTKKGSSGAPILLKENHKVIGIQLGKYSENDNIDIAIFMHCVISDVKKNNIKIEKEKKNN